MRYLGIILLAIGFLGCGHHRDVRPGTEGVHTVVVTSEGEEAGQRDAIAQANHFCKERYEKVAAIEKEGTKYTGDMDEEDYKMAKTAGKILQTGGSQAWVFGGKKERSAGGVASGTGNIIRSSTGKGYTTQMKFKCI
jgi:hypothetical protein